MRVLAKGYNEHGQLNDVIHYGRKCEKLIEMKLKFKIKQIACGYYHVIILTEDNELYGCGYNYFGQLELKGIVNVTNFTKINTSNLEGVIKSIQCGDTSSVLLTTNNNIYRAGTKQQQEFKKIDFNFDKITLLRCGGTTIVVMNDRGEFYFFGTNFGFVTKDVFEIPTFQKFYVNSDIIDFQLGGEVLVLWKNIAHWIFRVKT